MYGNYGLQPLVVGRSFRLPRRDQNRAQNAWTNSTALLCHFEPGRWCQGSVSGKSFSCFPSPSTRGKKRPPRSRSKTRENHRNGGLTPTAVNRKSFNRRFVGGESATGKLTEPLPAAAEYPSQHADRYAR